MNEDESMNYGDVKQIVENLKRVLVLSVRQEHEKEVTPYESQTASTRRHCTRSG